MEQTHEMLMISAHFQTAFAAETQLAVEHWLEKKLNLVKLRMFRVGRRMLTVYNNNNVIGIIGNSKSNNCGCYASPCCHYGSLLISTLFSL
jgi:hypothetical protein